jgi:methylated-DNA-protein-cysteine methyltransferase-like protein
MSYSYTGTISSRGPGTNGAQRQAEALEAEGVDVRVSRAGQFTVDFATYGWFPATLEAAAESDWGGRQSSTAEVAQRP